MNPEGNIESESVDKNIGSFFESPGSELFSGSVNIPWVDGSRVSYVQSGRQALAVLAAKYAAEGRNILFAPDYLCESMLLPFDLQHWQVHTYRLSDGLMIESDDLIKNVTEPSRTVILSATYFGNEPSNHHISVITSLRSKGVRVIEDETHRLLGDLELFGDVAIASLRKVLPVADGAYIRGNFSVTAEIVRPHKGWRAMDKKADADLVAARKIFSRANKVLTSWLYPPARMSTRTLHTLASLDYEELRKRRRTNAEALRSMLINMPGVEVINSALIPSHLVVRVAKPKRVQALLARAGIFCPIHWPHTTRLPAVTWRDNLLSLPVDHRYAVDDMRRIATELKKVVAA